MIVYVNGRSCQPSRNRIHSTRRTNPRISHLNLIDRGRFEERDSFSAFASLRRARDHRWLAEWEKLGVGVEIQAKVIHPMTMISMHYHRHLSRWLEKERKRSTMRHAGQGSTISTGNAVYHWLAGRNSDVAGHSLPTAVDRRCVDCDWCNRMDRVWLEIDRRVEERSDA